MFQNLKRTDAAAKPGAERATTPGHMVGGQNAAAVHRKAADTFYRLIAPTVSRLYKRGLSLREVGTELERLGFFPRRGGSWGAAQVRRAILRAEGFETKPKGKPAATVSQPAVASASPNPANPADAAPIREPSVLPPDAPAPAQEPSRAGVMLSVKGEVRGPYTLAQVAEMLHKGQVSLVSPFRLAGGNSKWAALVALDLGVRRREKDSIADIADVEP